MKQLVDAHSEVKSSRRKLLEFNIKLKYLKQLQKNNLLENKFEVSNDIGKTKLTDLIKQFSEKF